MKKFLSLLGVLFFISSFQVYAEKKPVILDHYFTGHVDRSKSIRRSPMQIPIDVYYDEELRQIEICSYEDMNVQIYLCDENGNTIACSSTINTILDVPNGYSGQLYIRIEGEDWIATGKINSWD